MTDKEFEEKLEIALRYASLGWRIIVSNWPLADGTCSCRRPHCTSVGKHPRMTDWVRQATTDPKIIRIWLDQWPLANISIVTGRESGIIVVDVDKGGGGIGAINELIQKHGRIPETPHFWTSCLENDPEHNIGGYHLVFKDPGVHVPTRARIAAGIDVRGEGGQIIAPPSRNLKGVYRIDPERSCFVIPPAEVPPWLLTLITSSHTNDDEERDRVRFDLSSALQGADEGKRDTTIFKMACKMRDLDIPKDIAYDWCRKAAANCNPPFPAKLAEEKVDWAYNRYTPRAKWDPKIFERNREPRIVRSRNREWVLPYPIIGEKKAEIPKGVLPSWLEAFVRAIEQSYQVPAEMVATFALSTLGAGLAKKGIVRLKRDWVEPLNLYTVVADLPGGRKSQTFKEITSPIFSYQAELMEKAAPEICRRKVEKEAFTQELALFKKNVAKTEGATREEALARAAQIEEKLLNIGSMEPPRFVTDDTTPESLATLIATNHNRLALMSGDGNGVFQQMDGRYSGIPNVDIYVKGWNGDIKIVDRKSRSSEFLDAPALTINIAVQPKVMRGITQSVAAKQGFFARILYCFPNSKVGSRNVDSEDVPYELRENYVTRIKKILNLPYPAVRMNIDNTKYMEMNVLCFDEDALEHFKDFERDLEKQRGKEVDEWMSEWMNKLGGNTARLIGILHIAENIDIVDAIDEEGHPGSPWEIPISAETVDRAIELAKFFVDHAIAAFNEMESDPIRIDAIRIFNWIRRYHKLEFFKSEAIHALKRAGKNANMALTYLVERGYIRTKEENVLSMNRENIEYEVNPAIHENNYQFEPDDE